MDIGIVGLPNVGKSTLFNALTGAAAAASNFPFTTIDPNVGIVPLPDERLNVLGKMFASEKVTPAGVRFVDIAGLVKGASQGEGLGNQFLSHIRAVDAVAHVVRAFHDENVVNVLGKLDPLESADIIETELLLADLQQAQKLLDKLQGPARSGDKKAKERLAQMEQIIKGFQEGKSARMQNLPEDVNREYEFLTGKPLLYVANVDERGGEPTLLAPLTERAKRENAKVVVLCAKIEAEIVQLAEEERASFYESAGIKQSGLAELAHAGKDLLDLICFFTAGPKESRAWIIPKGTKAVKAAGKIHSDIERGFIRAEMYKYDDLVKLGSYKAVQEKGLVSMEGKDYEMKDGDVVYFRFNV
ncbi:MAG TPA: redox-regulated ATPase YchF [Elusimicrobiota bacterium]|nr:redox-regulated ATPase YchF [Elusimicrobiota bacterium]